jgi:hypothetical protein
LPSASEQDSVRIAEVASVVRIRDIAPSITSEVVKGPSGTAETQVAVPSYTSPVKFQSLHLKLRGRIFEVVARSSVLFAIEKPMHRINVH